MRFVSRWLSVGMVALLCACGGGSVDDQALVAQVTAAGAGSTLVVKLTDSAGTTVANNTIGLNSLAYTAQGQLRDSAGVALPNQLVTFTTDPGYGSFVNGTTTVVPTTPTGTVTVSRMSGITDATGVVKVQLVGKAIGAATLVAEAKVNVTSLTTRLSYAVTSAAATVPSGLSFYSATPSQIVISTASSGARQSTVKFRVVNEAGLGVASQSVQLSLDSQSIAAGVTFVRDGSSSVAAQTVTTDIDGIAQILVNAGDLPTGLVVKAALVSNPLITASSAGLSVSNGRVSQKSMSLSASSRVVEGFDIDGATTEITVFAADRLGNPVPAGTVVSFVASHGLVGTFVSSTTTGIVSNTTTGTVTTAVTSIVSDSKGSCTLDATSSCRVQLKSAGVRPTTGRLSVLAYADGEETFVDLNRNNRWDQGEPFTDLGMAYLDVNANFVYNLGVDQAIPGGNTGAQTCQGTDVSIADTCDGTWTGFSRARQRIEIIWATSQGRITLVPPRNAFELSFTLTDLNGNPMASGTVVTANLPETVPIPSLCRILGVSTNPSSTVTGLYTVFLNGHESCTTATITVTATSPSGAQTFQIFR
jgi:hypothetical protein